MNRPYFKRPAPPIHFGDRATSQPWDMPAICAAYNFPTNAIGPAQKIAIIELGGGYRTADIAAAFQHWNLPGPKILDVIGHNSPGGDADGEVVLDIEVAAAAYSYCTGQQATILMFFAENTDAGFAGAVQAAINSGASVISISWGGPEASWSKDAIDNFTAVCAGAAAKGVTILAASGDNDSGDGISGDNVDFPASCPHVIGCGGTIKPIGSGAVEQVWNDGPSNGTGGGYSRVFGPQEFQTTAGVPEGTGRLVPDLAANASPRTGYNIFLDGQWNPIGGTSAVAPLLAGLFAAYNAVLAAAGKPPLGFVTDRLYRHPAAFTDITLGNNGRWRAASGVDPCTGLGVPDGTALLSQLLGSAPAPTPTPDPIPAPNPPPPNPHPVKIDIYDAQLLNLVAQRLRLHVHSPAAQTDLIGLGK